MPYGVSKTQNFMLIPNSEIFRILHFFAVFFAYNFLSEYLFEPIS